MYYYLNSLYFYSLFGFILESTVYKIRNSKRHSSIFYGPITMVYGFGILLLLVVKKYFLDVLNLHGFSKLVVTYFTCALVFTLTEWIGGNVLSRVFQIDLWNYSNKSFHFGKYICLELALIWGFLGVIYIYFVKDFVDQILILFPRKMTFTFIFLNLIDTILVFVNKFPV